MERLSVTISGGGSMSSCRSSSISDRMVRATSKDLRRARPAARLASSAFRASHHVAFLKQRVAAYALQLRHELVHAARRARAGEHADHQREGGIGFTHGDAALGDTGVDRRNFLLRASLQKVRLGFFETAERFVETTRSQRHSSKIQEAKSQEVPMLRCLPERQRRAAAPRLPPTRHGRSGSPRYSCATMARRGAADLRVHLAGLLVVGHGLVPEALPLANDTQVVQGRGLPNRVACALKRLQRTLNDRYRTLLAEFAVRQPDREVRTSEHPRVVGDLGLGHRTLGPAECLFGPATELQDLGVPGARPRGLPGGFAAFYPLNVARARLIQRSAFAVPAELRLDVRELEQQVGVGERIVATNLRAAVYASAAFLNSAVWYQASPSAWCTAASSGAPTSSRRRPASSARAYNRAASTYA